ncbi:hypothetical protein [Spiroplasma culicicola]|uniref:Uncharacterized protein n=1 Tax=Spiroplasma culicicola AES-1 TaxID=1276246 RepID=W6AH91_9MOLU|nr:hypothetical protein [Spiroplasma culicicola]AHI53059.1 hypothetical protein SCULI_v1c07180 [Spiroplasma culicicola AES-1]
MAVERFFQKLSGRGDFYDFDDQLNYFDYFGIEPEDIIKMFEALEQNSNRMGSYMLELEQMIFERFEFYSSNIRDAKAGFIKIFDEKTIQSGRAYVASMIYLGARLIAQEFVLLSTANKANFSVDLRVYKFGEEKYNYRLYLKSLRTFYESLSAWSYVFIKNNEEMLTFFSKMDDYIDRKIYDLKVYKDIFMLIWVYAYVKQAKDIRDYHLSLDPQTEQHVTIRKNVLNPLNFEELFALKEHDEEKKRRARIDDYKLWVDPDLKQNIKDTKTDLLDAVPFNKIINLRDYFNVLDKLVFSFEYYNFYDYQGYMTNLFETVQKALGEKVNNDLLEEIIKNSIFYNMTFHTTDVLNDFYEIGIYKRPLIGFNDSQRRFFVMGYPEIIWMAIKSQEEYMLFDSPIRNKMHELVIDKMHDMLNTSLQKLAKRFAVINIFNPEDVPYFANRSRDKKANLLVDAIAYEKNAENCFFFFNNFFKDSPLMWDIYRNSLKTSVGPGNLLDRIVKNRYSLFAKDLKKIKKQMGLPKDAKISVVLIVNDVLEVNPKIETEEYDIYVVDYSTIEFFLTSFIYKK